MNNNLENSEEREFYLLAYWWRGYHSQGKINEASKIVDRYHELMKKFWETGWRGDDLLPTEELPDELMPKYFLEYWKEINKKIQKD